MVIGIDSIAHKYDVKGVFRSLPRVTLKLLGYVKVIGTLLRAMRVLAVAIRAVPRAARVLRLMAVFVRSYEGRRRSKDLHEASIVIQRRTGRHLALKVMFSPLCAVGVAM